MIEFVQIDVSGEIKTLDPNDMGVTHAIVPIQEYDKMMEELEFNQKGVGNLIDDAKERAGDGSSGETASNGEVERIAAELEQERRLNSTLLQMRKKEANSDRGLKPKKQHSGYVVMMSKPRKLTVREGRVSTQHKVYETTIQTPFSTDLSEEMATQAAREVRLEGEWSFEKIGLEELYLQGFEHLVKTAKVNPKQRNYVTNIDFIGNYRAKYWEVQIQHTLPIHDVPEEMLAPGKEKKGKKERKDTEETDEL